MNKLWDKGIETSKMVEDFTVGRDLEFDIMLAPYDVLGSIAHVKMLSQVNLITKAEETILLEELRKIEQLIEQGEFTIEEGVEDIHSQIELMLTRAIGEVGKKIHTARSRNDQVLVDVKLFLRQQIRNLTKHVETYFHTLMELSEKHKDTLMPGYTHLQLAMPSSFGLWFAGYAEALIDDLRILAAAMEIVNQNPLGSGAGYGSSLPINRTLTTQHLQFKDLHYNVIAAQMSRGKTERAVSYGLSSLASTLSKMAMDITLYMCQNFDFLHFPDNLTTGSSIMPHKKNPDIFELIRGKCNRIQAIPNEITLMTVNLPSGYHREYQLLKEILFPTFQELENCFRIFNTSMNSVTIHENLLDSSFYDCLFTVEDVNRLVKSGVPFRDAYRQVAKNVLEKQYIPNKNIEHTHEGSIGNLCNDKICQKFEKINRIIQGNGNL